MIVASQKLASRQTHLTGKYFRTIVITMVTVSKSVLKARMLEFFRQVEQTGEELVVTNDGVPVLKVVPFIQKHTVDAAFADVRGNLSWTGDLNDPTHAEWTDV